MLNLRINNQRGDTLVEVTLAVAVLAIVLTSAYTVTGRAAKVGQSAKERSQAVALVQQQAEIIQSFAIRDWGEFIADFKSKSAVGSRYKVATWKAQNSKIVSTSAAGFNVYYNAKCYKLGTPESGQTCSSVNSDDITKISFDIKAEWSPVAGSNSGGKETTQAVIQVSPTEVK